MPFKKEIIRKKGGQGRGEKLIHRFQNTDLTERRTQNI